MADDITYTSTSPAGPPNATKQVTDEHATRGHMPVVKLAYSADGIATLVGADVDGLLVNLGVNNDVVSAGAIAHDAVDSGNPLKIGGKAKNAFPTAVANNDRADAITDLFGRQLIAHIDPAMQNWKQVEATAAQTGTAIWTPAGGKRIAITSVIIATGGTTAGILTLWFGASGDTTFTQGTDQVVFRGEFAPSTTIRPGAVMTYPHPVFAVTADHLLRYTTSAAMTVYIIVYGYEF